MTSNTRVTNAQIMGSLQDLVATIGGLSERVSTLEGGAVVAQPSTGKANTRAKKGSPKAAPKKAPVEKTLTRSAWKRLRVTQKGTVRKAFAGLTREQAHAKGLCPGYRLPSGELRSSLSQG